MTPRALGVALLVCACALAGALPERARRARLRTVESWCAALELLCAELAFRAPPLPELLALTARRAGGGAARCLAALGDELSRTGSWETAARLLPALLPEEELRPLHSALPLLGGLPARAQAEALSEARGILLLRAEELRDELRSKGRVSRAAGLSLGLMLACLLW